MMRVYFLEAAVPLVKSFYKKGNKIEKNSYPLVSRFTSHHHDVHTIKDFYKHFNTHAKQGHCYLKGELQRELVDESRAGSTSSTTLTSTLVFDVDGLPDIKSIEQFIKLLPKEYHSSSYIVQYSASMGVYGDMLRAHIIFFLTKPVSPTDLKQWLIHLNLNTPEFRKHLQLTRTRNALKWPVDITVGQNDKLIYIAPPKLHKSIADPMKGKQRVKLITKEKNTVTFKNAKSSSTDTLEALNEVRKREGLKPKRSNNEKIHKGIPVGTVSDQPEVTGVKHEREFTYLNLNGGDSWGYYHPANNPDIIYNFKGESNYLSKELLPVYWAEQHAELKTNKKPKGDGTEGGWQYFACINKHSDNYYRGRFDEENDILEAYETTKRTHIADYMKQHGQYVPEFLELWDVAFDISNSFRINFEKKKMNTFQPTDFMIPPDKKPKTATQCPPTIRRVIRHALGSDRAAAEFTNWLAVIMQLRIKTGICWILHGTQGTGKGAIYNSIISPIFGDEHTPRVDMSIIADDPYNEYIEKAIFCLIDESQIGDIRNQKKLSAKLREYITEPMLPIRKMRTSIYKAKSFVNMIINSNEYSAAFIPTEDRRHSVGKRQETMIKFDHEDAKTVAKELEAFALHLHTYKIDRARACTPYISEDRELMQRLTRDSNEEVAHAITNGNFEFLFDNKPDVELPASELTAKSKIHMPTYKEVLREIYDNRERGVLSRNALQTIFYYTTGNEFATPHKFTKFLGHKGINTTPLKINGEKVQGIRNINWQISSETAKAYLGWISQIDKLKMVKNQ